MLLPLFLVLDRCRRLGSAWAQGLESACLPRRARRRQVEQPALPDAKSTWATVGEEQAGRQQAVEKQARVFRSLLPRLLKRLAKIADPRNPKRFQHQLTVVMVCGISTFVFQMASRREANRRLSRPQFQENLRALFPELIGRLRRKKKFACYLIERSYPVAIDGTQKLSRNLSGAEAWLEREVAAGEGSTRTQYDVYLLEAYLAFANGMTLPL